MDDSRMNIAVALDRNYVRYTYVMLMSLFENQGKDVQMHIYLLQSELIEKEKHCLENLIQSYGGYVHWLQIEPSYFPKECTEYANWPVESFYRLVLPEILPEEIERILYLDVDIVVNHSLKELYHTEFNGNALCACPEPFSGIGVFQYRDEMFKEHVREGFTYFNSGVLLMNLKLLREKYGLKAYMEVAQKYDYRLETPDQDLLNYVHWKDVKFVETVKYNLYARFAHNFGVGYKEAKEKVTLVHFLAGKPWNPKIGHFEMEQLWWDYAKESPFYYDFRREFILGSESIEKADKNLQLMTGESIGVMKDRKFKTGIPYMKHVWREDVPAFLCEQGFTETEINYEDLDEYKQWQDGVISQNSTPVPTGIILKGIDLDEEQFFHAVMIAEDMGVSYIVINTEGVASTRIISYILESFVDLLIDKEIEIYLENGYVISKQQEYICSEASEITNLKRIARQINRICDKECIGISIDVGNGNVLSKNLRTMIEEAGNLLKLVHINDNDGIHNDRQIPYTYTMGRGNKTTDWHRIIGELRRQHYAGRLIFNTEGIFNKAPNDLHMPYISLLGSIANEWEEVIRLEEYLNQPNKKIILFGAGVMAYNFTEIWGTKYRPEFLVDNDSSIWNTTRFGLIIKSPKAILEVPEKERLVFIANQYYGPIGAQLDSMGIKYRCYHDLYDV
ncbi:MAG: hypothetical protein IKW30_12815 [Lachnospiraceae bacterium]|nr:hypothetical protein [Lachnospiraceae bacterium]